MKKLIIFFMFGSLFLSIKAVKSADAFVIADLNFRSGPNIRFPRLGFIPAGQFVFVKTCKGNWCYIKYNTKTGWVSSRYLAFKNGSDLYHTYTMLSITNHSHYP
ncbi:SH3 domain-containing protein [Bartonella sp. B30(2025)]